MSCVAKSASKVLLTILSERTDKVWEKAISSSRGINILFDFLWPLGMVLDEVLSFLSVFHALYNLTVPKHLEIFFDF